jgi:hypothetical protein
MVNAKQFVFLVRPTARVSRLGWAGVDSAWEQEKLEARKMPENAADRASEPPANIAQSKRQCACHPTRQVHALLGALLT